MDEVFHFKYDIVNFKTHLMKKNCEKTTDSGCNSKLRYIPCKKIYDKTNFLGNCMFFFHAILPIKQINRENSIFFKFKASFGIYVRI